MLFFSSFERLTLISGVSERKNSTYFRHECTTKYVNSFSVNSPKVKHRKQNDRVLTNLVFPCYGATTVVTIDWKLSRNSNCYKSSTTGSHFGTRGLKAQTLLVLPPSPCVYCHANTLTTRGMVIELLATLLQRELSSVRNPPLRRI